MASGAQNLDWAFKSCYLALSSFWPPTSLNFVGEIVRSTAKPSVEKFRFLEVYFSMSASRHRRFVLIDGGAFALRLAAPCIRREIGINLPNKYEGK